MRGKDKNYFSHSSLKRLSFLQCCNIFVEIIKNPSEAFDKHITNEEKLKCAFAYISLCIYFLDMYSLDLVLNVN